MLHTQDALSLTVKAAGSFDAGDLVGFDGGRVVTADAPVLGVARNPATEAGQALALTVVGVARIRAAGPIQRGSKLTSAAGGGVQAATGTPANLLGFALEAAAAGEFVQVLLRDMPATGAEIVPPVTAPTETVSWTWAATANAGEIAITLTSAPPPGARAVYVIGGVSRLLTLSPAQGGVYSVTEGIVAGQAQGVQVAWANGVGTGPLGAAQTVTSKAQGGNGDAISVQLMGQSELEYLFSSDSFYRVIPQPTMRADGNLVLWTQSGTGAEPVRVAVNAAEVAAGRVNPAMAVLAEFLNFAAPGKTFILGDGAVPGTSRYQLADDADTERLWGDFTSVIDQIEAETGRPINYLLECWYNADAAFILNFRNNFWQFYFGTNGDGSPFTLGSPNANTGNPRPLDRCLWDGMAAPGEKGRGIFARGATRWHMLTPMPFNNAPTAPAAEMANYSQGGLRQSEPRRAALDALQSDALAQSVGLDVGPSAHITRFWPNSIHPATEHPDGQILLAWPVALAMLRMAGRVVAEPQVVGIEGGTSYFDMLVSLPNGGTLTTLRKFRGEAPPASPPPHYQPVVGVELSRGGERHPVYSDPTYAAGWRGTVDIVDAGSGTGAARRGRVRVTPAVPFDFTCRLSYMRGQGGAILLNPRDPEANLYLDMLIEHIPALHDPTATYPFPGIAVKPYQDDLLSPIPAPAFTPRSTRFNGTTSMLSSETLSVAAGDQGGTIAGWIYMDEDVWPTSKQAMQLRIGTTIVLGLQTTNNGRMSFVLTGGATITTPVGTFATRGWHHIAASWRPGADGWMQFSIDGAAPLTSDISGAAPAITNAVISRLYWGSVGSASFWKGDMGHFYANLAQALDLRIEANRRKFVTADGGPADLGGNGEMPTGAIPAFYLDGGASPLNYGYGGGLTPKDVTAGGTPA